MSYDPQMLRCIAAEAIEFTDHIYSDIANYRSDIVKGFISLFYSVLFFLFLEEKNEHNY